jgi:hypothetical protein
MAWWHVGWTATPAGLEIPAEEVGRQLRIWFDEGRIPGVSMQVSIEKYTMTPGIKTAQPAALMTMGVIEDLCRWYGIPFNYHQPATTKKQVSNTMLRKLGWWTPTKDGHVNDALRLCLVQLSHTDPKRYADLVGL